MALSDVKVRNAKPREQRYRLADADGLYIEVMPTGRRYWRMRYTYRGKRRWLTVGVYPAMTLAAARRECRERRELLDAGKDPLAERKVSDARTELTFSKVAERWLDAQELGTRTRRDKAARIENHLAPHLGDRPVGELTSPEVLAVLRIMESAGKLEQARKCRQIIEGVCTYAIGEGLLVTNPAVGLSKLIRSPAKSKGHPAAIEADAFAGVLRSIEGYTGTMTVRAAMLFVSLAPVRSAELRCLRWDFYDAETMMFKIPGDLMKGTQGDVPNHLLPVSRQASEVLDAMRPLSGHGVYVFPSPTTPSGSGREKTLSENTINSALNALGFKGLHTCHGFRSSFSTLANEKLNLDPDTIERCLAHLVGTEVSRAYNRGAYIDQMRDVLQRWADYCDVLRSGSNVVLLRSTRGV